MPVAKRASRTLWTLIVLILLVAYWSSCSYTAVSCWRRGGSVIENFFGWPTCVSVVNR